MNDTPLDRLQHHVTGAIERGEAEAIVEVVQRCPGCGSAVTTDEHLMSEYLDLQKHSFSKMFGHNAATAQNEVAEILLARGITEIPNIFGAIPVKVWSIE